MFRVIKFDVLLKYTAILTVVISMAIYAFVQTYWLPGIFTIQSDIILLIYQYSFGVHSSFALFL